ncbi:hypothetical protein MNV49_002764 [Pseudohyphozyma bogoriensis]|nr:hypothetical protein MNV49_002764 [Pseudohyphozyma bogoriensis]
MESALPVTASSAVPSLPTTYSLAITVSAFQSFATPAITVPFPSAYQQTQIPFAFSATPTWAATRIPTTIGGVAATSGISSQLLAASGATYGQGSGGGGGSGWPKWATGVIAGCGAAAVLVVLAGIWCFCTRGKRRANRKARAAAVAAGGGRRKQRRKSLGFEKHVGGGGRKNKATAEKNANGVVLPQATATRSRQPYPPYPHDNARAIHSSGLPYPAPPQTDAYGRYIDPTGRPSTDSRFIPSGYATPDLEAPGYVDGGSDVDSPARLWAPSEAGTPRSSLSVGARNGRGWENEVPPPLPVGLWSGAPGGGEGSPVAGERARRDRVVSGGDEYETQGLRDGAGGGPRQLFPDSPVNQDFAFHRAHSRDPSGASAASGGGGLESPPLEETSRRYYQ